MIVAIFDQQVTLILPIEFWVNWPFCSREQVKNRFLKRELWLPYCIFDQNNFTYVWSTSHPDTSYQVSSQWALRFRRNAKYISKVTAILDFRSERSWIFFIYKFPWCFLPSFDSVGLLSQEKKRKIGFQYGIHGSHFRIPIGMILAIFDLKVTLMRFTKFWVNWPFG